VASEDGWRSLVGRVEEARAKENVGFEPLAQVRPTSPTPCPDLIEPIECRSAPPAVTNPNAADMWLSARFGGACAGLLFLLDRLISMKYCVSVSYARFALRQSHSLQTSGRLQWLSRLDRGGVYWNNYGVCGCRGGQGHGYRRWLGESDIAHRMFSLHVRTVAEAEAHLQLLNELADGLARLDRQLLAAVWNICRICSGIWTDQWSRYNDHKKALAGGCSRERRLV